MIKDEKLLLDNNEEIHNIEVLKTLKKKNEIIFFFRMK